jgi:hypothetical protein
MKYTVVYRDNGDVLAVIPEQSDIKNIKIDTFEIPDNHIIDGIDTSKTEHTAVSHSTGMVSAEELVKQAKAIDMLEKTVMELTSLVMSDEATKDDGEQ